MESDKFIDMLMNVLKDYLIDGLIIEYMDWMKILEYLDNVFREK